MRRFTISYSVGVGGRSYALYIEREGKTIRQATWTWLDVADCGLRATEFTDTHKLAKWVRHLSRQLAAKSFTLQINAVER